MRHTMVTVHRLVTDARDEFDDVEFGQIDEARASETEA